MPRQPVLRPLSDEQLRNIDDLDPLQREALLHADTKELWRQGHFVLAYALCRYAQFLDNPRHVLTWEERKEAWRLRVMLGLADQPWG